MVGKVALGVFIGVLGVVVMIAAAPFLGLLALAWLGMMIQAWHAMTLGGWLLLGCFGLLILHSADARRRG